MRPALGTVVEAALVLGGRGRWESGLEADLAVWRIGADWAGGRREAPLERLRATMSERI